MRTFVGGALALCLASVALAPGCALRWGPPLDPAASPEPALALGAATLRYAVAGPPDAPVVLLIHGFGSSKEIWAPILPSLIESRVLSVDLLGFGGSSRVPGDYSPDAQAEALVALLDHLAVETTTVIAHSLGSTVALTLALRAPERVERLLLIAPFVYEEQLPWAYRDAQRPGLGELIIGMGHPDQMAWRLEQTLYDDRLVTEPLVQGARASRASEGVRAAALATLRGLELGRREASWSQVQQPVLVLAGAEDFVVRVPFAERLVDQLPVARLDVLPLCGHVPMVEAPAIVGRVAAAFVRAGQR